MLTTYALLHHAALQSLLDACESYGNFWCLTYNPLKCKVMTFGSCSRPPCLRMYGEVLESVQEYKYLGVSIVAGTKFSTSTVKCMIRFRSSANTILNASSKSSEPVLMKLLFTICVPHLTYALEVLAFSTRQLQPMNVALNDCIRRIFGYDRWESVRFLRISSGYPSLTDTFHARSRQFERRLSRGYNPVLKQLYEHVNA